MHIATLSETTPPLIIQDLRSTMLDEYIVLERHGLGDRDDEACKTTFDREAAIASKDLQRAAGRVARRVAIRASLVDRAHMESPE